MARLLLKNDFIDPRENGDGECVNSWDMQVIDSKECENKYILIALDRLNYMDVKAALEEKIKDEEFIQNVAHRTSVYFSISPDQARVLGDYLVSISKEIPEEKD